VNHARFQQQPVTGQAFIIATFRSSDFFIITLNDQRMKKITLYTFGVLLLVLFAASGCEEPRYMQRNNHHSPEYYQRHHHRRPPPGIDINIHN